MSPYLIIALMVLFINIVLVKHAFAYIDPGTGSYLFQIMIAAIFGGLLAIKLYWNKLKYFIRKLFYRNKKSK